MRINMKRYCKNCAAPLGEFDEFCQDCGKPVPDSSNIQRFCPGCGEKLTENEYFCRNCGLKLKEPEKKGFLSKYKTPLAIIAVIVIILIVAVGAYISVAPVESQDVQVDTLNFTIPSYMTLDEDESYTQNDGNVKIASTYWYDGQNELEIDVISSSDSNFNPESIAKESGGTKQTLMGHEGYLNESDGVYEFSFVKDNKLCTVYTTSEELYENIEVV